MSCEKNECIEGEYVEVTLSSDGESDAEPDYIPLKKRRKGKRFRHHVRWLAKVCNNSTPVPLNTVYYHSLVRSSN